MVYKSLGFAICLGASLKVYASVICSYFERRMVNYMYDILRAVRTLFGLPTNLCRMKSFTLDTEGVSISKPLCNVNIGYSEINTRSSVDSIGKLDFCFL